MTDTNRLSFADRQKEAALAQVREQAAERRRISDLVLGNNGSRSYVTEVVKLGHDYIVEITAHDGKSSTWTTVVEEEKSNWHHERQEEAILHLIARRYDSNVNTSVSAAFYAARVLGVPAD